MAMDLYHTSPVAITRITKNGRFGEFLFFSSRVYTMTAGEAVVHKIELDDDVIIDARSLFFHEGAAALDGLVAEFCERFGVEAEEAEEIIAERQQLDSTDSDDLWDVQHFTARAAKLLGFRGVRVSDEQGAAYIVAMLGHEAALSVEHV
jgi:hypothetical protein